MFLDNKYYKWYINLIEKRRLVPANGYTEEHHIIPLCLGGNNSLENLIKLTAREHFICHWLLTKCVTKNVDKINYALWLMTNFENKNQSRYKINSKKYELIKKQLLSTFISQHKGRAKTEEHKKKISEARKRLISEGKLIVNQNKEKYKLIAEKRRGKTHSAETREKIRQRNLGKVLSAEQKEKLSKLNTGKKWSEESKNKLRETMKKQYASGERLPKRGPRSNVNGQ